MSTMPGGRGERRSLLGLLPDASRALTVALVVVTAATALAGPAFTLVTGLLVGSIPAAVGRGWASPAGHRVLWALALATGLFVVSRLLGPLQLAMGNRAVRRIDEMLTLRMMAAVLAPRGLAHLEDPKVADAIDNGLGALTGTTPGMAVNSVLAQWGRRATGVASLALVAGYRWWLAGILLGAHVVAYRRRAWHWHQVTNVIFGHANLLRRSWYLMRVATEGPCAKETRVFSLAGWLVGRYGDAFDEVMTEVWRNRQGGALGAVAVTAGMLVAETGAVALVAVDGLHHVVGLATVVVVTQAVIGAAALSQVQGGDISAAEGSAALRALVDVESRLPSPPAGPAGDLPPPARRPAAGLPRRSVCFEGVWFRYPGSDEVVLRALDLEIEAGRSLAIVGCNGAGKTTLVKLLAGLYQPSAGRILVDGTELGLFDHAGWQRQVAAIFQDFVAYHLSAHDNVALGALHRGGDRAAVREAAERAGAAAAVERLAEGWDTVLSRQFRGGCELSGGEWQRLALARALFALGGGARLLVLDEPTAALDVKGESEVYARFLEMTQGVTTVVISHRFSTVRRADRIVVLDGGRLVEDGSHDRLVAASGLYAEMYRAQAAHFWDSPRRPGRSGPEP
ncbi:MAG: ATP-binding cassette domain-containing protein [Acidimicrobiales bacterium]